MSRLLKKRTHVAVALVACALSVTVSGAAEPKVDLIGDPLPDGAIVRCGTVRFLPRHGAWAVALSPDGKTVAVGSMPGSGPTECVELWNTATALRIASLASGSTNILALAWSPDGQRLAISHDGRVEVIAAFDGKVLVKLPQPSPKGRCGWSLRWTADGKRLAAMSYPGELCVWDVSTATVIRSVQCGAELNGMALSADGRQIAVCGQGLLQVRDSEQLKVIWTQGAAFDKFKFVAFSPDGTRLVCSESPVTPPGAQPNGPTRNARLQLRDARNGRLLEESEKFVGGYADVAFTPDGKLVASIDWRDTLRLWDTGSLKKLSERNAPGYIGLHLSISADGKSLATAGRRIMVWDLPDGTPRFRWETHGANVHSVAFLPAGNMLVSAGKGGIFCWDAASGRMLRRFSDSDDRTGFAALSHDGKTIAAGVGGTEIRLWDVASGNSTLMENTAPPSNSDAINTWSMDFRSGDNLLAMGLGDKTVRLWDRTLQKEIRALDQPAMPMCVKFSPDGKLLAAGAIGTNVRLYELESAKTPSEGASAIVAGAAAEKGSQVNPKESVTIPESADSISMPFDFVPGSTLIAVPMCDRDVANRQSPRIARSYRVRLWDYVRAKSVWESKLLDLPRAICISPDGRLLAASTFFTPTPEILVWSVKTGKLLKVFQGHEEGIAALAFSADSERLASAGEDATLLIWDVSKLLD